VFGHPGSNAAAEVRGGVTLERDRQNVRFLAGFRHERRFDRALLDELRAEIRFGQSLGEASRCRSRWPEPPVRSALLHLVWTHHFTVDLTQPLTTGVTLEEGVRA
jgi:hypothetical protein